MVDKLLANKIERGISFPTNRSVPPKLRSFIASRVEDLGKDAGVPYDVIDKLLEKGLIYSGERCGITYIKWTYEGKKLHLKLIGWDRDLWLSIYRGRICCTEALPLSCVCEVRTICKEHGKKCHGSHD